MTKLLLAILATVAGLVMVGGGIYGIVNDVSDDDDSPSTTTSFSAFPSVPTSPSAPGGLADCDRAAESDSRLGRIDLLDLQPAGEETGTAEITPVCSVSITLFVRLEGMKSKGTSSYYVWLYKNRRRAKQIGSLIGSDGRASGSATIHPEVDTTRYEEIVITRVPFGKGENRPRRIIFRGSL